MIDRIRDLVGWRQTQTLVGRRYGQRGLRVSPAGSPEPGLAILNAGKRDVSFDLGLPVPVWRAPHGALHPTAAPEGWSITALNDQHAYLRWDPAGDAAPAKAHSTSAAKPKVTTHIRIPPSEVWAIWLSAPSVEALPSRSPKASWIAIQAMSRCTTP